MTAQLDPSGHRAAFATFRPHRGRAVALTFGVLSLLVFGGLAVLLPTTGYAGWSVSDSLGMFGVGALLATGLWRFASLRAQPTDQGLLVRNVLLTRRLDWAQVRGVRFSGGDAWAWLDLDDGDELAVMAIQRSDGAFGRAEASRLAALVQAKGGPAGPAGAPRRPTA